MNYKQDVNWMQIKQDYISGVSAMDLSSKYNIPYTTLKSKINKENWGIPANNESKELQNIEFLTELSKEREQLKKTSYSTTMLAYEKVNKILSDPDADLSLKDLNSVIKTSSTIYSTAIGVQETKNEQKAPFSINDLSSKSANELLVMLCNVKIVNKDEKEDDKKIDCEYTIENE